MGLVAAVVGIGLPAGGTPSRAADTPPVTMETLQEVYLLLRLGPLQLTAEQCEAVLGVLEHGREATEGYAAGDLWALRQRLLAGEPATAADTKLLRQAGRQLRPQSPAGSDGFAEALTQLEQILTVEQRSTILGVQTRGAIIRTAADTRAAKVVLNAVTRAMNAQDPTERTRKLRAILDALREVCGELMDEAAAGNLGEFLTRVEQMGLPEFTTKGEELLAEIEVLVPSGIDPAALSVALEGERARGLIQSLFFNPLAAGLVRERLELLREGQ